MRLSHSEGRLGGAGCRTTSTTELAPDLLRSECRTTSTTELAPDLLRSECTSRVCAACCCRIDVGIELGQSVTSSETDGYTIDSRLG